ncbi:MAG: hypothetical protein R2798_12220 [Chitinophagales bacterium]|nr:hypothetical protein [Bacteroidota bacterium]MCB9043015.1 hypothetical protein [Chitinophagales bacterium]
MRNPTRRNRNIGTKKQGYGQDNELTIPEPVITLKSFYERHGNYKKEKRIINGHEFILVTEQTRETSKHACTIDDIEKMISNIPVKDYGKLKFIILRQPKRKEENLSSVWGRLVYSYEFEDNYFPAIIIEANDYSKSFKWSKKLSPDTQDELERLRKDGHNIIEEKRYFTAEYKIENVRQTQLYRTLLHEFGHYVHYLEFVERPGTENEEFEEWEKRRDDYFKLSTADKEKFAHKYADNLKKELTEKGVIPFEKI